MAQLQTFLLWIKQDFPAEKSGLALCRLPSSHLDTWLPGAMPCQRRLLSPLGRLGLPNAGGGNSAYLLNLGQGRFSLRKELPPSCPELQQLVEPLRRV